MRVRQAIGALFQVLVVMACFSLAGLLIFLEYFPFIRFQLADLLLHDPSFFRLAGCVLLATAFLLYGSWKAVNRSRILHVKMGETKVAVGGRLLKNMLAKYMEQSFPGRFALCKITAGEGNKWEIHLRALPNSPPVDEEFLLKLEQEFSQFLSKRLGYTGEFYLRLETISELK